MEEQDDVNIKSEELNEVLSAPPLWIIRWGITVIFLSLAALFVLSAFIKYPDKLTGPSTVSAINPPVRIATISGGKISQLLIKNNDTVSPEKIIMVMENTANYEHILYLEQVIKDLKTIDDLRLDSLHWLQLDTLNFGELTSLYTQFKMAADELNQFIDNEPQTQEIEILDAEIQEYNGLQDKYKKQEKMYAEELAFVEKDFKRSIKLFANNVISEKEHDDKNREWLQTKRNYESMKITTANTAITLKNLEKSRLQLTLSQMDRESKLHHSFYERLHVFQNTILDWKKKYVITSPITGKISFSNPFHVNQNVTAGDEIASVVSLSEQKVRCTIALPAVNTGKLKLNQKVQIQLADYPTPEYGFLVGFVSSIPPVSNKQDVLTIEVELPKQLLTSYNMNLKYKEEMKGVAFVITEDLSLLDRFFSGLRSLMDKK